jgi:hypothetical protein
MNKYNLATYDEENPDQYFDILNECERHYEEPLWDDIDSTLIGGRIIDLWDYYEKENKIDIPKNKTKKKITSVQVGESIDITADLHITDELDGQTVTTFRKEQAELRKGLLGNCEVEQCVICGKQFPADMLWTAHIKKRSHCSFEEKRDLNIVALMCKTGCDDLFERVYIGVIGGKITLLRDGQTTDLRNQMNQIEGRDCTGYSIKNEDYYEWHANNLKCKGLFSCDKFVHNSAGY